jgi:AcrR family transcriptional regulator
MVGMTQSTMSTTAGIAGRRPKSSPESIIPAAWALFEQHGYDESTMHDVAAAVGLSRRTLFNYFPTKEALLFPAVDEYMAEFGTRLAARPLDEPLFVSLQVCLAECQSVKDDLENRFNPGPVVLAARFSDAAVRYSRDYWATEMERAVTARLRDQPNGAVVAGFVGSIAAQVWTETSKRIKSSGGTVSINEALAEVMTAFSSLFE